MAEKEQKPLRVLCVWRKDVGGFKDDDYRILSQAFDVTLLLFRFSLPCLWKLFFLMRKQDVAYAWFANVWAFFMTAFAKIWGVKTVIVTGGYDVANVPEIDYGLPRRKILRHFARFALKRADLTLPFSKSALGDLRRFVRPKRAEVLYCGCKVSAEEKPSGKRKNQVVTAGLIGRSSSRRKGHFEFLETARQLPDGSFLLVGKAKDETLGELKRKAPPNVEFTGFLDDDRYERVYMESKVYLQLSRHEGFGVSVVEAMLRGCTPVVSASGSLPEIVGSAGEVLESWDPRQIAETIRKVLEKPGPNREAIARAREFSLDRRARELIPLIRDLGRGG